jgi:hypothetical protein
VAMTCGEDASLNEMLNDSKIYRAILDDAMAILRNPYMRDGGRKLPVPKAVQRWRVEREWVLDGADDSPFSFERCCMMAKLDPAAVRWQLRRRGLLDPDESGAPPRRVAA